MIDKSLFYDLYWVFDLHKQKDVRSRNYESQYKVCKRVRNKKVFRHILLHQATILSAFFVDL